MPSRFSVWMLLSLALFASPALAHKPSDSYLRIFGGGAQLTGRWDIALKDLEFLIGIDANQNGQITWGELKAKQDAISAHALSRLTMIVDGRECTLAVSDFMVTAHSDGKYAVLMLETDCPGDATAVKITYDLLFDVDPTHRGLVLYSNGALVSTHVLGPGEPSIVIRNDDAGLLRSLVSYIREGVWHIWIGFDHILFLVSLLLPAVLIREEGEWRSVDEFRPAARTVLRIVTVFTLAHSITLWLAVMEYMTLPSQFVEATIAFSIIVTALNNLYPVIRLPGWLIAFVFGLIHGFGFANVLLDLGLSSGTLAVSLLGFNVGVELGQLAIVVAFMPSAFLLRGTRFYQWFVFRLGSLLIAAIAAIWMAERVFNLEILGF